MLRPIFRSRLRLVLAAASVQGLCALYGWWLHGYVEGSAASVELNLVLTLVFVALMVVGAFPIAVLGGDLLWGERWRRRRFLGFYPTPDEVQPDDLRDHSFAFYVVVVLAIALTYVAHDRLQGSFFAWYAARGFELSRLRSSAVEERIEAVRELAAHDSERMRAQVLARLSDPEPRVRAAVAEAAGWERLADARPALLEICQRDEAPVRAAALLALGQIGGDGVLAALRSALGSERDPRVRAAILGGLGLRRDSERREAIEQHALEVGAPMEVRRAAVWALGRVRDEASRPALGQLLGATQPLELRCAALHALGQLDEQSTVPAELVAFFRDQRAELNEYCPRTFVTPAVHERCFEFLNSRASQGYTGSCVDLQASSPEPLGCKALRSAARIARKGAMDWLAAVNHDEELSDTVRNQAGELFYQLKGL